MTLTLEDIKGIFESENLSFELVNECRNSNKKYTLASIKSKVENGIYFLTKEYIEKSNEINDSIIIIDSAEIINPSNTYIRVKNPQLAHYKLSNKFEQKFESGIHPTAIIDKDARISDSAFIGPFCVIGKCTIHSNVALLGNVTVNNNVEIRANSIVESYTVIGARGMAWIWDNDGNRVMQSQLGGVVIEENCILGSNITIVRGSLTENTKIGRGTILAHGTKIGHGCQIQNDVHMANNVSLAGNVYIEERVFLGSGCVVSSNVRIAEGCIIGAGAVINKSVTHGYSTLAGVPGKIINKNNFNNKPNGAPMPFKKTYEK